MQTFVLEKQTAITQYETSLNTENVKEEREPSSLVTWLRRKFVLQRQAESAAAKL